MQALLPSASSPTSTNVAGGDTDSERLCLLDNAKVCLQVLVVFDHFLYYNLTGEYVDIRGWLSGSEPLLKTIIYGKSMVMMPTICFISGICSQGAVTHKKRTRYVQYLVAPTLIWIYFAKPVIMDSLMSTRPETLWGQLNAFISLQAFHEEWYLQALVIWRGLALLLWSQIHPIGAFISMMFLSCAGGYFNLSSGPVWFLKLSEALGFLPYFAIGYVFPFRTACHAFPRPRNQICILVMLLVVAWIYVLVPKVFPEPLPDGHGSYHCCGANEMFMKAQHLDLRFYWARRFAKTIVEILPVLALVFMVLPRGITPLTWVGPHTLYPFVFHLLAHHWRNLLITRIPLPRVSSLVGHLLVLALHVPYCIAVVAFFASPVWRGLFGWALSPSWLSPLMASDAMPANTTVKGTVSSYGIAAEVDVTIAHLAQVSAKLKAADPKRTAHSEQSPLPTQPSQPSATDAKAADLKRTADREQGPVLTQSPQASATDPEVSTTPLLGSALAGTIRSTYFNS